MAVSTAAAFSNNVSLGARIAKTGVAGTAAVPASDLAPSAITKGSYFINGIFTIPQAVDGTEATLINVGAAAYAVNPASGVTLGATSIELTGLNSTITLRCFENKWYIISAFACTIS